MDQNEQSPNGSQPVKFIDAYCAWERAMISDPATATLVFDSLCRFMQHWMLNEGNAVDLGFAKLYALQARATWKLAAYSRLQNSQHGVVDEERVRSVLLTEPMTAWNKGTKTLDWTVEAVPSKAFMANTQAIERQKRLAGNAEYYLQVADQFKRQLPLAYEIFRHFLQEATKPMLVLDSFYALRRYYEFRNGKRRFHNHKKPSRVTPAAKLNSCSPVNGLHMEKDSERALVSQDAILSEMRDLQPQGPDVRDHREDVEKSDNGRHGDAGLLVSDAIQGEVQSELLDGPANCGHDGMAERTEQQA